ncbi:MAG: DUF4203 domain-containing protein [Muribaculaceae bacterium]|nr:DUF4203 domain-containing protein [Muribaculaceae bacterium]
MGLLIGIGIILLIYGVVKALFGYKLYKISLFFVGFLVGAVVGGLIGVAAGSAVVGVLAALLLGVLFGFLNIVLAKLGIFIQCFAYGFMAVMAPAVMKLMDTSALIQGGYNLLTTGSSGLSDPRDMIPIALIVGIIIGIIGVIFSRIMIILTTAVFGGMAGGVGLCLLVGNFEIGLLLIVAAAIAVLGMGVQFLTTGRKKDAQADTSPNDGNPQETGAYMAAPGQGIPMAGAGMAMPEQAVPMAGAGIVTPEQSIPMTGAGMGTPEPGMAASGQSAPRADFSRQTAAAQEYASKALDSLKENGGRAVETVRRTGENGISDLKARQRSAEEAVRERNRGFSMEELLIQLESCLYQNRVMAWIFPFLEAITIAAAVIFIIIGILYGKGRGGDFFMLMAYASGNNFYSEVNVFGLVLYGIFYGLELGKILFILAAFLGMIKRRPWFVFIVCGIECLTELVMGIMAPFSFLGRIWTIALYLLLMFWCYRIFFVHSGKTQMVSPARRIVPESGEKASNPTVKPQNIPICPQCGTAVSPAMKFCAKCGQAL